MCLVVCLAYILQRAEVSSVPDLPADQTARALRDGSEELRLTIQIRAKREVHLVVTNETDRSLVISMEAPKLSIVHESTSGKITSLIWDASNADIPKLSPFRCVYLPQKSTYILRKAILPKNLSTLNVAGKVYAVVSPLSASQFDPKYRKEIILKALLSKKLISNVIQVKGN